MAEYIKREDAINALCLSCNERNSEEPCEPSDCEIMVILKQIPSADVAPVKHGEWILEYEPDGKPYCFHCSVCDGDFHYIGITTKYDFCPNCGAKMEVADGTT